MPVYKLYHTNHRGRAELIRWIFLQTGVKFEDVRFTKEEWTAFKPKTPYGVLPVLEVDGKLFGGSGPIARYVAEQHGLAGSNAQENFELACIYDATLDLEIKLIPAFDEKDQTRKEEYRKEVEEKHVPTYLGIFEKLINENSSNGWIFGKNVTYLDFRVVHMLEFLSYVCAPNHKFLDGYPGLTKLKTAVESLPNIAKWIQERPKTEF